MSKIELSTRMVRVLAAVILAATFILGAAAGAAIWHSLMKQPFGPPPPQDMPRPMKGLNLTPEQQTAFDSIFEKYRPKLDEILEASFPKIREVKDEMDKELRALLTPEQQKIFDEMVEKFPPLPPRGFPRHPHEQRPPGQHGGREVVPPPMPFAPRDHEPGDAPPEMGGRQEGNTPGNHEDDVSHTSTK